MSVARPLLLCLAVVLLLVAPGTASAQTATTTTVASSVPAPVHGQVITLTATVSTASAPDPTGTVRFLVDGVAVGPAVALVNRTATVETQLRAGQRTIRAEYQPNPGFAASDATTNLAVAPAGTSTTVRVTPGGGVAGQDFDLEATVTSTTTPLGAPTGTVTFMIDGVPVMVGVDANGVARLTWGDLGAGSYTISAGYSGDMNHAGSGGSAAVTFAKAGTFIVLSATPNPAKAGENVRFSAFVDSYAPSLWWPSGVLTGSLDGVAVPGSVTLIGRAGESGVFERSFGTQGAHTARVHFAGDRDFLDADAALTVTVAGSLYADPFLPPAARRPLAPRGLALKATPSRDRRKPYKFAVSGTLQLPASVTKADGCSGRVTVEAKVKAKRVARKTATVTRACTFKTSLTSTRKGSVSITAKFAGNASVSSVDARAVKVKAG